MRLILLAVVMFLCGCADKEEVVSVSQATMTTGEPEAAAMPKKYLEHEPDVGEQPIGSEFCVYYFYVGVTNDGLTFLKRGAPVSDCSYLYDSYIKVKRLGKEAFSISMCSSLEFSPSDIRRSDYFPVTDIKIRQSGCR
jgi:hypothetical protein